MPPNSFNPAEIEAALGGRFKIEREIRAGAQGAVFRAQRIEDPAGLAVDNDVALKVYFETVELPRVAREIKAMDQARHPNLAALIEHGEGEVDGDRFKFTASEFVCGEALDDILLKGPLSPSIVAAIGRDLAAAVAEIWRHRIVHRDLKPSNVMVRGEAPTFHAILIDLGVARHLDESSLTAYGSTWGTRGYMSPEQGRTERNLTCKSDLYSLGMVLHESLSGEHPTGRDQGQIQAGLVQPFAEAYPMLPGGFSALLDSLIAPRAVFRPDPTVLAAEFARWADLLEK
jgi:eukaryotic-like serine/threonine-protein kinase